MTRATTKVLVTDHPGESVAIEREVLGAAGAEVVVAHATDTATLAALAADVDAIITCFTQVSATVLNAATRCRTVARTGVGVDNIDLAKATDLGMIVSNVPVYCTEEVADHALSLILALSRRLIPLASNTAAGGWDRHSAPTPFRLRGKVLGLVGLGAIGRALVPRAQALGLEVVALQRGGELPPGVTTARSLTEVLEAADVISLHVPLTEPTRGLIGAAELAAMKPTALLINTARGGLVDTDALTDALRHGRLAGAGLDVTEPEPLSPGHLLRTLDNVILTPHSAFASDGAMAELSHKTAANVVDVLRGKVPHSLVNPEVLQQDNLRLAGVPA
ncbi:C-terminal binding protein [Arthrobacter sp.]|uniref:C-terminal binding protein n=1 Tax=Arthrobacter sp. TaxID=1667 RepID=UPI0028995C01|nr:C-terminal binding protein [Arthrobacter sp.]